MNHVESVRSTIANRSACESVVTPPPTMKSFVIVKQLRLVTKTIPIHAFGNGLPVEARRRPRARVVLDEDRRNFSQATISNEFAGILVDRRAALLRTNLQHSFVFSHCFNQCATFRNTEAEWLFRVDIQTFGTSDDCRTYADVIGRRDHDRIEIFRIEHLFVVLITLSRLHRPLDRFRVISCKGVTICGR